MSFQKTLELEQTLRSLASVVAVWRNNLYLDRVTTMTEDGKATQTRFLPDGTLEKIQGKITYRRGKEDGGYPVTETIFIDESGDVTKLDSRRI